MAEVTASAPSPSKKAKTAVKKEKAPANHPKYIEMAVAALNSLKERNGSSRQAIHKYICKTYQVDSKVVATHLKIALKRGVDTGVIKHVKGVGASGSFKANQEALKKKEKKEKKPKAKASKPKAKTSKPKKAKASSPAKAKAAKSPKKATKPAIAKATKSPKKATKKVASKATKPKKVTPKKKVEGKK